MKRVIYILTAVCIVLCLAGCVQAPPAPTAPSAPTTPPTTEPTEPSTPPPPPETPTKTVFVHSSITQEYGSAMSRTEYLFDEQDWVTEVVVYTNGVETKRHSVECDENGNYIRWISDGSVMEYTYDAEGHSLGMAMYIGGSLVSSTTYTWENGLRTSVTTQMASQNMTQKVLMTYNANGILLRQDSYSADTLTSYSIYATGEDGQVQSMTTYLPDGSLHSQSTHSWEGGSQTITTTDPKGAVTQIAVLTYDEHGNLLTHEIYDADKNLISKETHTWRAVEVELDCPRASV